MQYKIKDDQIHVFADGKDEASFVFWPEDLIKIVEAQEAGTVDAVVPDFAALLSEILEERRKYLHAFTTPMSSCETVVSFRRNPVKTGSFPARIYRLYRKFRVN